MWDGSIFQTRLLLHTWEFNCEAIQRDLLPIDIPASIWRSPHTIEDKKWAAGRHWIDLCLCRYLHRVKINQDREITSLTLPKRDTSDLVIRLWLLLQKYYMAWMITKPLFTSLVTLFNADTIRPNNHKKKDTCEIWILLSSPWLINNLSFNMEL